MTLTARPAPETAESQPQETESGNARLGIVGLSVTPPVAEAMDLPATQTGVLIEQIEQGSTADMANLRGSYKPATVDGRQILVGGDIIIAFDDRPVETLADLQNALQQANPDDNVSLRILRDGEQMEVSVTLGEG